MPLEKAAIDIPFGIGIDTKTDQYRVPPGKMLELENAVFTVGGQLTKRPGFDRLPSVTGDTVNMLATYSDSLVAVGARLHNYSPETEVWYNKGAVTNLQLSTEVLVRSATSQSQQDSAVSPEGLVCSVWADSDTNSKYNIVDSESKQVIVPITNLPATATVARVFVLGRYFIITFLATVSAASHLQYIAIPLTTPLTPGTATDMATDVAALTSGYDGYVANNTLYFGYSATGPNVKLRYLTSTLVLSAAQTLASRTATKISVTADLSTPTPTIWFTFFDTTNSNLYAAARSSSLVAILAPTVIVAATATINQVTSTASDGSLQALYQRTATYSYSAGQLTTDFISKIFCTTAGVVSGGAVVSRGVALGSKAFIFNSSTYLMAAYGSNDSDNDNYEPTYFLIDTSGNVLAKLAFSNGGGYPSNQVLPSANVFTDSVKIGYMFKSQLTAVNKSQGVANTAGIYAQTGINIATFTYAPGSMQTAEIGANLHLAGGIIWTYDGVKPVEQNFHLWPEDILVTTATTGGFLEDQQYFYAVTYEWTDAAGNLHRSAPSVPFSITTAGGDTSANTVNVPTLRLTYKTAPNAVRIVIYRWSVAQQNYYQITSITSPLLNNPATDSVSFVDTLADSSILGNQLIYTTGGVIENIGPPAATDLSLYRSRLFLVDAEDENLLWYSKQVIEATPVEMSDLFTLYVAPTTGVQGSTGATKCLFAMDDKNIFFKENAIYYNTGQGPDNTGGNNDFSDPTFITATVGSDNPASLILIPQGLMFQSSKGIWLLGRDLSTSYIGASVQAYNDARVLSAVSVPGTNQVRFNLDNGVVLMYDYYYDQWGTFSNISAVSSVLYEDKHTYLNSNGLIFQQSESYLDGSTPVNRKFKTAWFSTAGVQGFQRAYFFYLLGNYISPHKLQVQISYNYDSAIVQSFMITPDNFNPTYGESEGQYGAETPYGGHSTVEQWKCFFKVQKCQSFQITVTEVYDASHSVPAGEGFTLSGIKLVVGTKKGYTTLRSARSTS